MTIGLEMGKDVLECFLKHGIWVEITLFGGIEVEGYLRKASAEELKDYKLVNNQKDYKFAEFRNYNSLIPMAQTSQKPIFELTAKDGVIGGHIVYVKECGREFEEIAEKFCDILDD